MTALDDLPADQRAVLELVLARGRDYDEIAALLQLDRAAVRERALGALDALGPQTGVDPVRRALITDYLLGQLPAAVGDEVYRRLAREDGERAWARVVASELTAIAVGPLPEIPPARGATEAPVGAAGEPPGAAEAQPEPTPAPSRARQPAAGIFEGPASRRSSRRGGAVLLAAGAVIVIVVVVIVVLATGGSSKAPTATTSASTGSTTSASTGSTTSTAAGTSTGTGSTASGATVPAGASNFVAEPLVPATKGSKAAGIAATFTESGQHWLALVARNLPANDTQSGHQTYYAVWLTNATGHSVLLGFAPTVTSNGRLETAQEGLAAGDSAYKDIILTLETTQHPSTPGTIVIGGPFELK